MRRLSTFVLTTIFVFFGVITASSEEVVDDLNTAHQYEIQIVAHYYAWTGKLNDNDQVIINNHDAMRLWEGGVEVAAITRNPSAKVYGINNHGLMVGKLSSGEAVIWGYDFSNPI